MIAVLECVSLVRQLSLRQDVVQWIESIVGGTVPMEV